MNASNDSKNEFLQDTEQYKKGWIYHEWNQVTEEVEIMAEMPRYKSLVVVHSINGNIELMETCKVFESEQAAASAGWIAMMESASYKMRGAEVFKKKADELRKAQVVG